MNRLYFYLIFSILISINPLDISGQINVQFQKRFDLSGIHFNLLNGLMEMNDTFFICGTLKDSLTQTTIIPVIFVLSKSGDIIQKKFSIFNTTNVSQIFDIVSYGSGLLAAGYSDPNGINQATLAILNKELDTVRTHLFPIDSSYSEYFESMIAEKNGNFSILGHKKTDSSILINDGEYLLVKLDNSLNQLWEKSYNMGGTSFPVSFIKTYDEGYLICGWNITGQLGADVFKTDSLGNIQWIKHFESIKDGIGQEIFSIFSSSGVYEFADNYYALFNGDIIDYTNFNTAQRIILSKLKKNGDILWVKNFGDSNMTRWDESFSHYNSGIIGDGKGNLYIGGTYNCEYNFNYNKDADFYVIKSDTAGNVLNEYRFGDQNYQEMFNIIRTSDSGFLMIGFYKEPTFQNDEYDVYIVKTDSNLTVTSINGNHVSPDDFTIYPNPSYEKINIQWYNSRFDPTELTITNITGNQMLMQKIPEHVNFTNATVSAFAPGIYLISIKDKKGRMLNRKFVIRH